MPPTPVVFELLGRVQITAAQDHCRERGLSKRANPWESIEPLRQVQARVRKRSLAAQMIAGPRDGQDDPVCADFPALAAWAYLG